MTQFQIYEPSPNNEQHGSFRFGHENAPRAGGRKDGYPYNEVIHTLNETNLDTDTRWCNMKTIHLHSLDQIEDNWINRLIPHGKPIEHIEIILIMEEGSLLQPIQDMRWYGKTWYKVALFNRTNNNIIFRTIVHSIRAGDATDDTDLIKTNSDGWYQFKKDNRQPPMGADITFWRKLKQRLSINKFK